MTEGRNKGKSFSFRYFTENDVMEYSAEVEKFIPCNCKIEPYIENMEMGAKICPDDVKRAIAFFGTENRCTEYLRYMDHDGNYRWYQIECDDVIRKDGTAAEIRGTFSNVDDYGSGPADDKAEERILSKESFFRTVNRYLEEIPIYDIADILLIEINCNAGEDVLPGAVRNEDSIGEPLNAVKDLLRSTDIIGRFSDNMGIVCLKGIKDANILCDRADAVISCIRELCPSAIVSVGIAAVPQNNGNGEMNFAVLYDMAYEALDNAKQRNKSTYSFYYDNVMSSDQFKSRGVSLHDIELVKNILDPIITWAYAIDDKMHLVYKNGALMERIPGECNGYCYEVLKGQKEQCVDCPLRKFDEDTASVDCDVYSPSLRSVLHTRTTRLLMKNNIPIYIVADVNEDISRQMEQMHDSMDRFNKAMLKVQDIIWEVDLVKNVCTRIREVRVLVMTEKRVENYETLRKFYLEHAVHPEDRENFIYATDPVYLRAAAKIGREVIEREVRLFNQDGSYHWYSFNSVLNKKTESTDEKIFIMARDINDLKNDIVKECIINEKYKSMLNYTEFQNELEQNYERSEHVNELTGIYVFEYNVPEKSYYICTTFEEMFNVDDAMKQDEWSLLEGLQPYIDSRDKYADFLMHVKNEPDTHETTLRLMNRYDTPVWFTITVQTLKGINNKLTRVTCCIQDVNTEMEIKAELEFRADFDSVTGLYNSESFYMRTDERIHLKQETKFAIVSIDIDRFRIINDRFGVEVGNRCLRELGKVIHESIPWDGIAARYQADIFSVLVDYTDDQDILSYIEHLGMAFHFDEASRCGSTLSFGIYKIVNRDLPVRLMCDRARLAKSEIKGNTLTNFSVYDDRIRVQQRNLSDMESEMQIALDRHEFIMYLQPKVSLKNDKICGAEALVRWQHPIKGLRLPGDFLPLFENNGFVKKLDEYMWESAAIYLAKLKEQGLSIPISVNISRLHVNNTDLVGVLSSLVEKYKIEPRYLELEITETLFTEDIDKLYRSMNELKHGGFVIEMDDFGSGYSSLNMLKDAPVDVIKIDRFFIDEIMATKRGRIIIENSVSMSKQLGLSVVAEGVETREQVEFLKAINCDVAQGYYYSKPVPAEEFERLLRAQMSD